MSDLKPKGTRRRRTKAQIAADKKPIKVIDEVPVKIEVERPYDVFINDWDSRIIKSLGFDFDWLAGLANQYSFTKYEYMAKFKAFRCYQENTHVDWISINDLSLLNGGRQLEKILLKHSPVDASRAVIKFPWR